jgi:hypothetical protein
MDLQVYPVQSYQSRFAISQAGLEEGMLIAVLMLYGSMAN